MALVEYKDLCIDATDPAQLGRFWAAALRLEFDLQDNGDACLSGATPQHTIWINGVPEAKSVKHRVHLDIRADRAEQVAALGASLLDATSFPWTLMADPEGGELCVFTPMSDRPALASIVVDAVDHRRIAQWWADVLGAECAVDPGGFSSVTAIPGAPFDAVDFAPVPEPKTVKNRIHIDVLTDDLAALIDAGATVLRPQSPPIRWTVFADPEGNEFCAFTRSPAAHA